MRSIIFFFTSIAMLLAFAFVWQILPSIQKQIPEKQEVAESAAPAALVKPKKPAITPVISDKKEKIIEEIEPANNVSPYSQKVKISKLTIPSSSRASRITLRVNLKKEEKINITGWKIKGRNGSAVIPQAIKKYLPGYNYADKDIFVEQGDKIYLSGSSNPLGKNRNFLNNKCFGYIAKNLNFTTPVTRSCPKPKREEISHLHPCCQEFINKRVKGCVVPDYSKNFKIYDDQECVDFLNKTFNYEGCFRKYSRDEDFLKNDWHIYLNTEVATNSYCDTIYLIDQNGLVVDKYSYGRDICR